MSTIDAHLAELLRVGLIRPATTHPAGEYLFHHALIQEAAYTSLLKSDRRRLHQWVGDALETLDPAWQEEFAPLLAQHFAQAGAMARAVPYFERAATRALAVYSNAEAEIHYTAALLVAGPAQRGRLLKGLGQAQARQSHYSAALLTWRTALTAYAAVDDGAGLAETYALMGLMTTRTAGWRSGVALCREGLAATAGYADSVGLFTLWNLLARLLFFNGLPVEAREWATHAHTLAARLEDRTAEAEALLTVGIISGGSAAILTLERAIAAGIAADKAVITATAHHNLAVKLWESGELRLAQHHFAAAHSIYARCGLTDNALLSFSCVCMTALLLGDFALVVAALPQLTALVEIVGRHNSAALPFYFVTHALARYQGQLAAALLGLQTLLAQAHDKHDTQFIILVTDVMSGLLLEQAAWEPARVLLQAGLASSDLGLLLGGVWPRSRLSEAAAAQGDLSAAQQWLVDAQTLADPALGHPHDEVLALATARLACAAGRWEAALTAYAAAAVAQAALGKRWCLAQTQRAWAAAHLARGTAEDVAQAVALLQHAQATFAALDVPYYVALVAAERAQIPPAIPQ